MSIEFGQGVRRYKSVNFAKSCSSQPRKCPTVKLMVLEKSGS